MIVKYFDKRIFEKDNKADIVRVEVKSDENFEQEMAEKLNDPNFRKWIQITTIQGYAK